MKQNKRKFFHDRNAKTEGKPQWDRGSSSRPHDKAPQSHHNQTQANKDECKWCKSKYHHQKDCPEFLSHLLKKGEDIITFVDESLYLSYAKSSWWIDSHATIHAANSL